MVVVGGDQVPDCLLVPVVLYRGGEARDRVEAAAAAATDGDVAPSLLSSCWHGVHGSAMAGWLATSSRAHNVHLTYPRHGGDA